MNREETKALAEEIVRALLERVGLVVSPAPAVAENPEPIFMTAAEYAKRVGYGRTTVLTWLRAGMPAVQSGRGSRVNVKAADAWIAAGGARRALDA